MNISDLITKIQKNKKRYRYLLLLLFLGMLLMLLPSPADETQYIDNQFDDSMRYSIEVEEKRLEQLLSEIDGVGRCKVLLSVHTGAEKILAEDNGETVVLSESGKQSTVTVQTRYPTFQGAVIVSGGCKNASVRYNILSSVMAYTGLSVDRITICPIKE